MTKWKISAKIETKEDDYNFNKENFDDFYQENLFNIFNSNSEKEHILCVGQVQSGKTKNIENCIEYAYKNKYKLVIFFAGINRNLFIQTENRIKDKFSKQNLKNAYFINLNSDYKLNFIDDSFYVVSILKYSKNLESFYKKINYGNLQNIKVLIIDDECDYASLNITNSNNSNNSKTFEYLKKLYERMHYVKLISFTGTPFANIMSSNSRMLKPDRIVNLINYEKYCGLEFFNKQKNIYIDAKISKTDFLTSNVWNRLEEVFLIWLYSTACMLIDKGNVEKVYSEFLINVDVEVERQAYYFKKISGIFKKLKSNINYCRTNIQIQKELECLGFLNYEPEIVLEKMKEILNYLSKNENDCFVLLNGENQKSFCSGHKNFTIIVSGFLASRGVTFKYLITELFLNSPTNTKLEVDTLLQRCRWFGNRLDTIKYLKVITNQTIIEALKQSEKYVQIFKPGSIIDQISFVKQKIRELDEESTYVRSTNSTKRK